jgi:hypothetical protein
MSIRLSSLRWGALAGASLLAFAGQAHAAPPTKEECVAAHAEGQDAREAGQLVRAGKLFLTCAEEACPPLVQSDCARFADELSRVQPTVSFAARDGAQRDLPDTAVYVDGALAASRLDGKPFDLDPGRHEVRFLHAGKEMVVEIVVSQGEKGRSVVGVFPSPPAAPLPLEAPAPSPLNAIAPAPSPPELRRPVAPLVFAGLGVAAAAAGGVLFGVGLSRVPSRCSLSTRECAAPAGDPVFAQASSAVTLANLGGIVGGAGLVTVAGSLVWYLASPPRPRPPAAIAPWIGPGGAGLSVSFTAM